MRRLTCTAIFAVLLGGTDAAQAWSPMSVEQPGRVPLRGEAALKAVCAQCHNLQMVMDTPRSLDGWTETIQSMIERGAHGTDEQLNDIVDYLHHTMTSINVNTADQDELATVLDVPVLVAQQIVRRRTSRSFTSLADLKSVQGVDASGIDARARLISFK